MLWAHCGGKDEGVSSVIRLCVEVSSRRVGSASLRRGKGRLNLNIRNNSFVIVDAVVLLLSSA
jgi:hypothetical protein